MGQHPVMPSPRFGHDKTAEPATCPLSLRTEIRPSRTGCPFLSTNPQSALPASALSCIVMGTVPKSVCRNCGWTLGGLETRVRCLALCQPVLEPACGAWSKVSLLGSPASPGLQPCSLETWAWKAGQLRERPRLEPVRPGRLSTSEDGFSLPECFNVET